MTIPVIYDVCKANPDVHFVFASRNWITQIALNPPRNLSIVVVDFKEFKGLRGVIKLACKLRTQYRIDAMADLHSVLRSWIIELVLMLHGVTVKRIDKGRKEKKALISGKSRQPVMSTIERYRLVFDKLGLDTRPSFSTLFHNKSLPQCTIAGEKPSGRRWIAIAPFSAHDGKTYPVELMEQVINLLSNDKHSQLFLFGGGKKERECLFALAESHINVTSVPQIEHSLADEMALLARCDVMVSMDSANIHLASLVGLPVVSIWGATHPSCGFLGFRQSKDNVIQMPLECRPCSVYGNRKCKWNDYRCLTGITPEQIVNKVNQITENKFS